MKHYFLGVLGLLLLSVSGCDDYPKDVEGTTSRVLRAHSVRAGIVEGIDRGKAQDITKRIGDKADADVDAKSGPAAILLRDLEHGALDVVIGKFAENSPWSKRVTVASSPSSKEGSSDELRVRPVLRKGENRWYMFIEGAMKGDAA